MNLTVFKGDCMEFFTIISNMFFIGVGLLGFSFLIGFHELGHFLFCKLFNIPVPSFSIGFGPRIWEKKIGETTFALSAVPFGGYVEIADDADASTHTPFKYRPYYQKLLVMLGGIFFNIIFTYVTLTLLFAIGMPKSPLFYPQNAQTTINIVEAGSPAAKAGLMEQDTIVAVNSKPVTTFTDLLMQIDSYANQQVTLDIQRNGNVIPVPVTLSSHQTPRGSVGYLGITPMLSDLKPVSLPMAFAEAFICTKQFIINTFTAFISLARGGLAAGLGGPVMLIAATKKSAQEGIKFFLLLLAFISTNLAVLNIFPFPILDGGQILFATIEAIIRRQIPDNLRWYIFALCWLLILPFMLYLSIHDIRLIFGI